MNTEERLAVAKKTMLESIIKDGLVQVVLTEEE